MSFDFFPSLSLPRCSESFSLHISLRSCGSSETKELMKKGWNKITNKQHRRPTNKSPSKTSEKSLCFIVKISRRFDVGSIDYFLWSSVYFSLVCARSLAHAFIYTFRFLHPLKHFQCTWVVGLVLDCSHFSTIIFAFSLCLSLPLRMWLRIMLSYQRIRWMRVLTKAVRTNYDLTKLNALN